MVALPVVRLLVLVDRLCCGLLVTALAPGAGSCGEPNPSGTFTSVALGDHPAAKDFLIAAHLLVLSTANAKILVDPKGLVHISVQCDVE